MLAFGEMGAVVKDDLVAVGVGEDERTTESAGDRSRDERMAIGDDSVMNYWASVAWSQIAAPMPG